MVAKSETSIRPGGELIAEQLSPVLVIIIPSYNEELVVIECASQVSLLLNELRKQGAIAESSFMAFVDDGSKDQTWAKIEEAGKLNHDVRGLRLSRNFGHQNALMAGLEHFHAACDITICIDADLQHDIQKIPEFIAHFKLGNEIVYGVKRNRSVDTPFKKMTAQAYYKILEIFGVNVIYNHADFRLMSRKALQALLMHREVNLFLRGMVPSLGLQSATIEYDVKERFAGESKYSIGKMLGLAIDGITSFSTTPLRMVSVIGILTVLMSLAATVDTIYAYYAGDVVRGWSSVVISIFFLGGVQMLCLGIIGEYVAKIYMEIKARPRYIVESEYTSDKNG